MKEKDTNRPNDFTVNNEPAEVALDVSLEKSGGAGQGKTKTKTETDPMDHDPNLIQ